MFKKIFTAFVLSLSLVITSVTVCSQTQTFRCSTVAEERPNVWVTPTRKSFFSRGEVNKLIIKRDEQVVSRRRQQEIMRRTTSTVECSPEEKRQILDLLWQNNIVYIKGINNSYPEGLWFEIKQQR